MIPAYPRNSTGDTRQIYITFLTAQELQAMGYIPVVTAGSSEVIWTRYR
jgi:predicted peroxiredoxin